VTFYLLVALISGLVSFGASWGVLRLSHRFKLYPGIRERDVHTTPTPRLGGIAIAVIFNPGMSAMSAVAPVTGG
jgi:UDP-GlcNAc:undecaprenyl-phosphate GlcNAc-1-phosphate transferase